MAGGVFFGGGTMPEPALSLNGAGSLIVSSSNPAVGCGRWEKRLTIAYRGGKFVVAGYDYSSHDTLGKYPDVDFQANYLTGKVVLNGEVTNGRSRVIPLAEWVEPELD